MRAMRAVVKFTLYGLLWCALLVVVLHATHLPMTFSHVLDHHLAHTQMDTEHSDPTWQVRPFQDACASDLTLDLARKAAAIAITPPVRVHLWCLDHSCILGQRTQIDVLQARHKLRAFIQVFRI